MRIWLVAIVATALLPAIAGCISPFEGPDVIVVTLEAPRGFYAGNETSLVFKDEEAWSAFWSEYVSGTRPTPARPRVPFDESYVLVIFGPLQPDPCYSFDTPYVIESDRIAFSPRVIPSAAEFCGASQSRPTKLLRIDDLSKDAVVAPVEEG